MLHLSDFKYELPIDLIAQEPLADRDQSRLLVRSAAGGISHNHFCDLPDLLPEGTLLIVNDSRVIPSRLIGRSETGGKVEIFLLEELSNSHSEALWSCLGKPMRKLKPGTELRFDEDVVGIVASQQEATGLKILFRKLPNEFQEWLNQNGYIPLPPYISREEAKKNPVSPDRTRYQTVYAKLQGSVAAPTAGLHFTKNLLQRLQEKEIRIAPVTLHVGAGTFLPVKSEILSDHQMHEERYLVPSSTLEAIENQKQKKQPVVCVGTTSLRCLESFAKKSPNHNLKASADKWHRTKLFIHPQHAEDRYHPWAIDGLITNFHQPGSTLFMLVAALLGINEANRIYKEAIRQRYRFLSYGDGNLFWL